MLRLHTNENVYTRKYIFKNNYNQYVDIEEYSKAKEFIGKYSSTNPSNIMITNGSYQALELISLVYLQKNDEIIIPVPAFPFYGKLAIYNKCKIKKIYYDKGFDLNLDVIIKAITKNTKVIYLTNPNNPTGTIITDEEIKKVLDIAERKNIIVIIDEAYHEFSNITSKNLINHYSNLIITRTFSKAYGLAGLRVGYIISNDKNIQNLELFRGPTLTINALALQSINNKIINKTFLENYQKEIDKSRQKLIEMSKVLPFDIYKSATNFVILKTNNSKELTEHLFKNNILVKDLNGYPDDDNHILENCIRITLGPIKTLKPLFNTIKSYYRNKKNKVLIVGAGSVGMYLGTLLDKKKYEVLVIGREKARKINNKNIIVNNIKHISPKIVFDYPKNQYYDTIFITTKSYDIDLALQALKKNNIQTSSVVLVQSTILDDILNKYKDVYNFVRTYIFEGYSLIKNNIKKTGDGGWSIEHKIGSEKVDSTIKDTKIKTALSNSINLEIANKLLFVGSGSAISALEKKTLTELCNEKNIKEKVSKIFDETYKILKKEFPKLDTNAKLKKRFFDLMQNMNHYSSMYYDYINNKKTEIDFINGTIIKLGKKHKIKTPLNKFLLNQIIKK